MGVLTIRNLDDTVKARLRAEAGQHGVSMEEQARRILTAALGAPTRSDDLPLGQAIVAMFRGLAGDGLELPARMDLALGTEFSE
jgi:plasmid stability protein